MLIVVGGIAPVATGQLGRTDRLSGNNWAGIRTRTTTRSDETWSSAHRAGGEWITAGGIVMMVTGIAVVFVDDETTAATVSLVGVVIVVGLTLVGGWLGQRVARNTA
jgi:hypothetical protein